GARGQFAQAYVIAHEIGHHLQKILGISDRVHTARPTKGASGSSVRLELQADCFARIWAHSTGQRNLLEAGCTRSAVRRGPRRGGGRRWVAAKSHGYGESRVVDARVFGGTGTVVSARIRDRIHGGVRHVRQ